MPGVVADTHAIVWYLASDLRLSPTAAAAFNLASDSGHLIHVPSICLVELTYLVEKGRLPVAARNRLVEALDDPTALCVLAPLDRRVADALEKVSRAYIPDLPDRIIAATAIALEVPVISRDRLIRGVAGSDYLVTLWFMRCASARFAAKGAPVGLTGR